MLQAINATVATVVAIAIIRAVASVAKASKPKCQESVKRDWFIDDITCEFVEVVRW